jgi:ATP-dependent DNA helicase RecG
VSETSQAPALRDLRGVGPRVIEKLERLGIETIEALLLHRPLRWEDRSEPVPIAALTPGRRSLVRGRVTDRQERFGGRGRRFLLVTLEDGTGQLTLRFFRWSRRMAEGLAPGRELACYGEPRHVGRGLEMAHPEYGPPSDGDEGGIVPVYPATEGLGTAQLRGLIRQALDRLDGLPLFRGADVDLRPAVRTLHAPRPDDLPELEAGTHPALRSLAADELAAHGLALRSLRRSLQARPAPALLPRTDRGAALVGRLPFRLTGAQERVLREIRTDLLRARPMLRLLQGDVGAGKTLVAVLAALHCVDAGAQAAVMAPTELLAEQHFRAFREWLEPLDVHVGWLSGRLTGRNRRAELADLADGRSEVVVGTHALFSADVAFRDLALVVIDEQHRFGVAQRLELAGKAGPGRTPHQLAMTATPIPRTLAMTHYGDFDLSVLDELPPGRTPIDTRVLPADRRDDLVARVREACRSGRQAYWVCPVIEESETLEVEAAELRARELTEALPDLRIGLVHGRLDPAERKRTMAAFSAGELAVLVATTVIEVGVDVPNASLMIVENAERLGLAQLHQLRGRVGRGTAESHCILVYRPPLSATGRARLAILRESTDGFRIAEADLALRGAGEILGVRQTGELALRFADLGRDADAVDAIRDRLERMAPGEQERLRRLWLPGAEVYGAA